MKKNAQIHIWLETELKELLEKQAQEAKISLNELCRQKLIESPPLVRIEYNLKKLTSILENKDIYKVKRFDSSNNKLRVSPCP